MDANKKKLAYSGVGVLAIAVVVSVFVIGGGMLGSDDSLGPKAEIIALEEGVSLSEATNLAGMPTYTNSLTYYTCTDTDGGKNYTSKGIVNSTYVYKGKPKNTFTYTDKCTSSKVLVEYYCSGTTASSVRYNCPYNCLNGACNKAPQPTCTNECNTAGAKSCSGTSLLTCGNFDTDSCLELNSTNCMYGCENGACRGNISVVSTPSGAHVNISSYVSASYNYIGTTPVTLSRVPGQYSVEVWKESYKIYNKIVAVVAGQTVNVNAVLSPAPLCNDTDGGQNATVYGVVTYYWQGLPVTLPDKCNTTTKLDEAYCYSSTLGTKILMNCPGSKTCSSGRCA
jgi:hypothetical protein